MALMLTGLSANTLRRLVEDSGVVYLDYGLGGQTLLGATRGGNSFEVTPEFRKMPFDGVPGDVKGDKRIVGVSVKLTVNLSEAASNALLLMANPGAASTTGSTHYAITRARQLLDADYYSNITLVLAKSNNDQAFYLKVSNVLATSPYKVDAKEKDESVLTVEFTGHFAVNALTTEPWEIGNPLEGASGFYTLTYLAGANGAIVGNPIQTVQSGADGAVVIADPASGYVFSAWSDAYPTARRQDLDVAASATVTATFVSA